MAKEASSEAVLRLAALSTDTGARGVSGLWPHPRVCVSEAVGCRNWDVSVPMLATMSGTTLGRGIRPALNPPLHHT